MFPLFTAKQFAARLLGMKPQPVYGIHGVAAGRSRQRRFVKRKGIAVMGMHGADVGIINADQGKAPGFFSR